MRSTEKIMATFFDPIRVGDLELKNRIVMAPLTRSRSGVERTPNALMKEYYLQRADAGLILTEATAIDPMGVGYADTPGIWSEAQVKGWKEIVDAVHKVGGKMISQLWHVGRISDPYFLDGKFPVAPSAIAADGNVNLLRPARPFVVPHALETKEVHELVESYHQAAVNAKTAGFDGVEIHAANGYLPNQFLVDSANQRTDEYGGSIENRARLLLELVDAAISVWGAGKVGTHLSPRGDSNSGKDSNPEALYSYVARELGKRKIAFLFIREKQGPGYLTPTLKKLFDGVVIANEGLDVEGAQKMLASEMVDLVSFGKLYISNPDLVKRLKTGASLAAWDASTFYTTEARGYTDYPSLS